MHGAAALVFILCCIVIAPALAASPDLPTVELSAGQNAPNLREFVRYKPTAASASLSGVLESLDEASLHQVTEPTIDFGPPKTPLLVLVKVRNQSADTGTWVFSTDRGSLRHIEMFEWNGRSMETRLANDNLSTQQEMLKDFHAFAFQFSLLPGEERVLGVVFEAESSTKLPLSIMEPRQYQSLIGTQLNIVLAATVGTLTLILLNAILFGVTGKSAFLHFVIAELALVFQAVHLSGYTTIFWFNESAELARALSGIAKVLFALFSLRFIRAFLRTRETWPRFERPAQFFEAACWLVILCLVTYPLIPLLTLRLASVFSVVIVAIALVGLPVIAAVAVKRYGWIYSPLVLGWAVWGIYLIYTILTVYTPLPEFPYQWRWMAPLGFFEALMLSIALGLDIRKMQDSESRAQKSLSEALKNRLELVAATAVANSDRALAEQQLRETSSLVRSGGHDSRSFTGALKMYGQVITNSEDIDQTRKCGALVAELAEELDATLNVIVAGSSEATASLASPVRIETMNAKALLETVKKIHEQAALQAGTQIRCASTVKEITGDRHLLIRLLNNLVSNAVKYARGGTILISARRLGGTTMLQVWDQGPGIKPEQLQRMLSPERMRERLNPEIDGTGSGLGICLELCEKMQTRLTARSSIGHGSVFGVVLSGVEQHSIENHQGIAIFDDPVHWPEEVVNCVRDRGMPIYFVKSFDEAKTEESGLIIVDPALHPRPPEQEPDCNIVLCSYEASSASLGEWMSASPVALAKPVTAEGVLHMMKLLNLGGQSPGDSRVN
jgi:two-component system, sensor histidine kinase LadS